MELTVLEFEKRVPRMPASDHAPVLVLLFPGQGAQYVGMGAELFGMYPRVVADCDAMLGYSIQELCQDGPAERLNNTQYTQPALYVVGALKYLEYIDRRGRRPACAAGLSLGEYNALLVGGAFDLLTGLRIVNRRAELMAQARNGTMAAVVGVSRHDIQRCLSHAGITSLDIANENNLTQYVLAGPPNDLGRAKTAIERELQASVVFLPVSGAFHSRYMNEARNEFARFLEGISFRELQIPVMANATGQTYSRKIPELLLQQLTSPVRWVDIVKTLFDEYGDFETLELGPGRIATDLVNSIKRQLVRERAEASVQ
jgi:trans-AT polyketide synthase/acyltransferase/oxidoreductase domain-containing protein